MADEGVIARARVTVRVKIIARGVIEVDSGVEVAVGGIHADRDYVPGQRLEAPVVIVR
jgi:hypothetical protein